MSGVIADNPSNAAGTMVLTKDGTGAWTFSNTNTYNEHTTVSNGTLSIDGNNVGSGAVTVNGGTLGGKGTIAGAVTVNGGGTLFPATASNRSARGRSLSMRATIGRFPLKFSGTGGQADLVNAALGALKIADSTDALSLAGTLLDLSSAGFIPNGNKYTVAVYNNAPGAGWNGNKFKNDIGGYVYLPGPFHKQFEIKYQDATPGGNFYLTETQPGSPNITGAAGSLHSRQFPNSAPSLRWGCWAAVHWLIRLGKRFRLQRTQPVTDKPN